MVLSKELGVDSSAYTNCDHPTLSPTWHEIVEVFHMFTNVYTKLSNKRRVSNHKCDQPRPAQYLAVHADSLHSGWRKVAIAQRPMALTVVLLIALIAQLGQHLRLDAVDSTPPDVLPVAEVGAAGLLSKHLRTCRDDNHMPQAQDLDGGGESKKARIVSSRKLKANCTCGTSE